MKYTYIQTNRDLKNFFNSLSEEQLDLMPIVTADEVKDRTVICCKIADEDCYVDDEYWDEESSLFETYDPENPDDAEKVNEIYADERNPCHRKGTIFIEVDDIPEKDKELPEGIEQLGHS